MHCVLRLEHTWLTHLLNCMVFMLKPSVGLMVDVSSPLMRFTMVVFPALSRPLRQYKVLLTLLPGVEVSAVHTQAMLVHKMPRSKSCRS